MRATLVALTAAGAAARNSLARTPPMGWCVLYQRATSARLPVRARALRAAPRPRSRHSRTPHSPAG